MIIDWNVNMWKDNFLSTNIALSCYSENICVKFEYFRHVYESEECDIWYEECLSIWVIRSCLEGTLKDLFELFWHLISSWVGVSRFVNTNSNSQIGFSKYISSINFRNTQ